MSAPKRTWFALLLLALLMFAAPAGAAEAGGESQEVDVAEAVTIADAEIPLMELDVLLMPLTRDQLAVEVEAWRALLEAKVQEISSADIAIMHKNRDIEQIQAVVEASATTSDPEAKGDAEKQAAAEDRIAEVAETVEAELKPNEGETPPAEAAEKAALEALQTRTGDGAPDEPVPTGEPDVADVVEQAREGADEVAAVAEEAAEAKDTVKQDLLEYAAVLRTERIGLIDRLNLVADAWEAKGAAPEDIEQYRLYATAVSGIKVDVSDAEAAWATLLGWLKSEEGGIRWALNVAKFVAILVVFLILARILSHGFDIALRKTGSASELLRHVVVQTIRRGTQIVGLVVAAAALEINIGPLLAVIGAAGFVVAFALQNTLSNIASGIMIMLTRPFDVDDAINVSGITGQVNSMNLVSTTVTTFDNQVMIVPNNSIWGNIITNINGSDVRRVDMVFGIGYDDDIDRAEAILDQVVNEHPLILKDPAPQIQLNELADSSVNFICRPWAKTEDLWTVFWDVTRAVKKRFDSEGISIPFPQRDVHVYHQAASLEAAAAPTGGEPVARPRQANRPAESALEELPESDRSETE